MNPLGGRLMPIKCPTMPTRRRLMAMTRAGNASETCTTPMRCHLAAMKIATIPMHRYLMAVKTCMIPMRRHLMPVPRCMKVILLYMRPVVKWIIPRVAPIYLPAPERRVWRSGSEPLAWTENKPPAISGRPELGLMPRFLKHERTKGRRPRMRFRCYAILRFLFWASVTFRALCHVSQFRVSKCPGS